MNEITCITKWQSDKDGNRPYFPYRADWEDATGTPAQNIPCEYVILRARMDNAELAKIEADGNIKILTRRAYTDEQRGEKVGEVIDYQDAETQLTKPQLDAVKAFTKQTLAANRTRAEYLATLITAGKALPKIEAKVIEDVEIVQK